jgi:hypothetical protein
MAATFAGRRTTGLFFFVCGTLNCFLYNFLAQETTYLSQIEQNLAAIRELAVEAGHVSLSLFLSSIPSISSFFFLSLSATPAPHPLY